LLIERHDSRQNCFAAAWALAFDGIGEFATGDARCPAWAGGVRVVTMPTDKPSAATKSVAKLAGKPFVPAFEESDSGNDHAVKTLTRGLEAVRVTAGKVRRSVVTIATANRFDLPNREQRS
jgi:hypothetical protein